MYGSYGSYGSYSSMGSSSGPMDITAGNLRTHDSACAFPSWPRRASLSDSDGEERATSYLSDDDLFLSDPCEDDARSVSSAGSTASPRSPQITEAELLEMERERQAMQRDMIKLLISEKERRRAAMKKQRAASVGAKKSPKSKLSSMTPIAEAGE